MQGKEYELVNQLAVLLLKNGDRILNGDSKLSLTTQSLSLLNLSFKRYSESKYGESSTSRNKKYQEQLQKWKFNVQYLHDFITKALSLKITHTSVTMQGPILISRFKSVQVLELKRVPIHMLEGLHKLRGQLRTVIVSRCLNSLQDFFEVCGGDQSSPMSWPSLKCIFLSYNGLKKLDSSLRLLPVLEVIDLSHNDLVKTESFLEHLTDIVRVNLGYNGLDSIPSFSLTARSHIKTLVLRNNNLDNIEGIEELCYIEELDISENCLCDHSCLTGLSRLTRLVMLSLQGNPLSFHISHRSLTLQHISVASGSSLAFTLDGKKITSSERELSQRSLLTSSLRPSQEAWDIVTHRDIVLQREGIAASYSFDDSDDIATSLKVGSPGRRRSRKKKQRAKSTGISDEETVDSSMTEYSSRDSSRATSPDRQEEKEDVRDSARSTKEEIQVLRDHYGENWLQVIAAKNEEKLASSASSRDVDKTETEDDIYLNESTANLTISGSRGSRDELETHTTEDKEVEDDIVVLPEPDINMQGSEQEPSVTPKATSDHSVYSIYRQHSSQGTEWNRMSDEDQSEYYGSESEPFIVTLSGDKPVQLLISVNNRYLIEKNINGDIVELLDLKCLDSFVITMGTVSDEISLPVCRIKFDYLRKDRRERKYVMEDDDKAQELKELLQPFLNAKEIDRQMKGLLQCLKCSKQFDKTTAEVHIHLPEKKDLISLSEVMIKENAVKYKCPKCNSDMVVELDTEELPSSLQNTPVGSYKTGFSLSSSYKANGWKGMVRIIHKYRLDQVFFSSR